MEVKVNDNWTIEPDNYGYILRQYHINRKKSKDGTPTKNHGKWAVKSTVYPSTIKSAVRCVLEKEAGANINHLQEFEDRIKDVEKNLTELIKQQKL